VLCSKLLISSGSAQREWLRTKHRAFRQFDRDRILRSNQLTTAATHLFRGVVDPSALSDLHIDDEKSVVELGASGFIWNEHGHAVARRSLTRHLAEEGTTFEKIFKQLRRRLAITRSVIVYS